MSYQATASTTVVGIKKTEFVIGNGARQEGWLVQYSIQGMGREIMTEQAVYGGVDQAEAVAMAWKFLGDAICRGLGDQGMRVAS